MTAKASSTDKAARKSKRPADSGDSVPALVRRIQAGDISTAGLTKAQRQPYVEQLTIEGYFTSEIAELLGVADRTVRRDLRAIRAAHCVEQDPETVKDLVGRLVWQADSSVSQIRRAVRSRGARVADKIVGQRSCWEIEQQLFERLQRIGYVPDSATNSPTIVPQNVSSLLIMQQMISQAREEKLVELGLPPGTTPADKMKMLGAIDALRAEENTGPDGRKI